MANNPGRSNGAEGPLKDWENSERPCNLQSQLPKTSAGPLVMMLSDDALLRDSAVFVGFKVHYPLLHSGEENRMVLKGLID